MADNIADNDTERMVKLAHSVLDALDIPRTIPNAADLVLARLERFQRNEATMGEIKSILLR